MKVTTGIVRKIDHLGRIVVPKEFCRTLQIESGTPLDISLEGKKIVISRHETSCIFCNAREGLTTFCDRQICESCREKIRSL
ncbi:MAG: AbrB family transcriptional regulator [Clostridia bacterium]|nr:AbrB family transcriptional regulator [Clostridia bacterium]